MEFLHRREQEVVRMEDMAKQQVADTEFKASIVLLEAPRWL